VLKWQSSWFERSTCHRSIHEVKEEPPFEEALLLFPALSILAGDVPAMPIARKQREITKLRSANHQNSTIMVSTVKTDQGKPGESRGRKANGSTITSVIRIARLPEI
jgi:hypothetical protein